MPAPAANADVEMLLDGRRHFAKVAGMARERLPAFVRGRVDRDIARHALSTFKL